MMESRFEQHNRIALNVVERLVREIPDIECRLIALESIIVGIIGTLPLKIGGDQFALDLLLEGAGERLAIHRLERVQPHGRA